MLITCSVFSSFWTCFSNWWHEKFNRKLTLSESTMFLLQAYATASWTLTVFCCVSTTKLIFFAPQLLDLTAYRNSKKHGTNFFRYVNASVISFKLHFTAILFHLSGLRLFPFNLVCLFVFCFFFPLQIQFLFCHIDIYILFFIVKITGICNLFFFVNKKKKNFAA